MSQSQSYSGRSAEEEERRQFFFDSIVGQETLQQHLLEQVNSSDMSASDRKIAELIIGNIDDAGFLQTGPEEIAQNTGMDLADLQRVLEVVHTFHPIGVGARDLRECLLIQLKRLSKEQSLEYRIVDRHLDDLGKRRFPEIARRLGTTAEQVQRAANFIATLDPKPGQIFTPDPNNYVLPDVTVEKIGGDWTISLNGEQIPHLRISNTYKDLMSQDKGGADVKDYIRDKIRSGKFLIKSIHQRQQTISNIAHEIVSRQKDFLEYGPSALKPMTMVQIADAVGVHETTVSRAISGKYMCHAAGRVRHEVFLHPRLPDLRRRIDEQHQREGRDRRTRQGRGPEEPAQRQGDRRDSRKARHPHRPPHRRQIPRRAEHPAEQHAQAVLNLRVTMPRDVAAQRPWHSSEEK